MRYVFEQYTLDTEQFVLLRSDSSFLLRPKVFQVLHYLLTHRDRVISKQELAEQIWPEQFISDAALEGVIKAVRRAVGDDGRTQWCIQTRRGQGYRFVATVRDGQEETLHIPERVSPITRLTESEAVCEQGENSSDIVMPDASRDASVSPAVSRRQLTVMFCDLVGSTLLSEQLDPEDLREVILAYHAACDDVITRFDGHTAQYLGDGLLVYFGYPQAHEDDAQRAVRAALDMIAAIGRLNPRLERHFGVRLAVRLGIHTGVVVVGPPDETGRQDALAWGRTPNIAARLQELATPDTVVLSAATYHLIEGYFICEALGESALKGIAQPVLIYQVLRTSGAESRLEISTHRGLTPFVGREIEALLLHERWERVTAGVGQVVLLTGEAGMGKSRLVQHLQQQIETEPHWWLEGRGSPYHQHSAFYAVRALLRCVLPKETADTSGARLEALEVALAHLHLALGETVPLLAPLLDLSLPAERYMPLDMNPERQRDQTLATLLRIVLGLAASQPVVVLVEDLHWVDPSTLEFLSLLIDQGPTARVYSLCTMRPDFISPWGDRSHITSIPLTSLSPPQVMQVVDNLTSGKTLPAEIVDHLIAKADGVPLFVEEMTKSILESDQLTEGEDHYEWTNPSLETTIPVTLHDALMARLDRLGSAKRIAQLGATIGRQFSYGLIHAVSPLDEPILRHELGRLLKVELLYQQGVIPQATYLFKHALIQETAYRSLLRSTRQQYHERIAQVLETQFSEVVARQPEVIARHYTEAGNTQSALDYWLQAGQYASSVSAYLEAQAHLRTGLDVLRACPDTPDQAAHELRLQLALGHVQMIVEGYAAAATEHAFARARDLAPVVGDLRSHFLALRGLAAVYTQQGKLRQARALGEQSLGLAQRMSDAEGCLMAHRNLGLSLIHLGEVAKAQTHFEAALTLSESLSTPSRVAPGRDLKVESLGFLAPVLWTRGYIDQALARIEEMLALANECTHPYSWCDALMDASLIHGYRGEWEAAQARAEEGLALAAEQGFVSYQDRGQCLRGRALVGQGKVTQGLALLRQGLGLGMDAQTSGAPPRLVQYSVWLVEAYKRNDQAMFGLTLLAELLTQAQTQEARLVEQQLYRVKGELLLTHFTERQEEAEHGFQQALAIARACEAKSRELQAALSLSRLWQRQGKYQDAYNLLAPVYGWFTEGFDTADLQEAKTLMHELNRDREASHGFLPPTPFQG